MMEPSSNHFLEILRFLDSCMDKKFQKKAKEVRGLSSSNNSFSPLRRSTNQHNFNLFVIYYESTRYSSNYLVILIAGLLISGRSRRYGPQYIPSQVGYRYSTWTAKK